MPEPQNSTVIAVCVEHSKLVDRKMRLEEADPITQFDVPASNLHAQIIDETVNDARKRTCNIKRAGDKKWVIGIGLVVPGRRINWLHQHTVFSTAAAISKAFQGFEAASVRVERPSKSLAFAVDYSLARPDVALRFEQETDTKLTRETNMQFCAWLERKGHEYGQQCTTPDGQLTNAFLNWIVAESAGAPDPTPETPNLDELRTKVLAEDPAAIATLGELRQADPDNDALQAIEAALVEQHKKHKASQ